MNQESLLSINSTLDTFFEQSIKDARQISPSYERLWRGLHTLISSGGKRLRPQMTLLAYAAFGGKDLRSILPIAAAQELLHFSLLIHDDIIDRSVILIAQGSLSTIIVGLAGLVYVANVIPYLRVTDATSTSINRGWRRFIWLNLFTGFVVTLVLIFNTIL